MPATKPRKRKITIRDVAKEAGVSTATVSYALNGRGSVSEEVRKRIQKTAEKLGYRSNRAARAMKMGRFDIIGLIIPNIENPFFAILAQAVLQECHRRGYQVFMVDTEGSQEDEFLAIQGLVGQGVDGIVIFPVDESVQHPASEIDVPVVVVDRFWREYDLVQAEYAAGGRMIAEYLVALGHKKFGILEGPKDVSSARDRTEGFITSLSDSSEIVWRLEHPFKMELTEEAQQAILGDGVTAIVCGNDLIAIATMSFLYSQNIQVPKNVSIVGFDDVPLAKMMSPSLTTIRMPTAAIGIEAVNLLVRRIDEKEVATTKNRILLGVELVVRNSTASPR